MDNKFTVHELIISLLTNYENKNLSKGDQRRKKGDIFRNAFLLYL